jgi:penicillin-binding protein 1C
LKKVRSEWNKYRFKIKEFWIQVFILVILLFLTADSILSIRPEVAYSKVILDRDGQFLHTFLSEDDKWRLATELDEITPELIQAIRIKEDRYFFYHFGINPISIVRAGFNNFKKGYRTSGASTITMQVVRLLHPKPRTYRSKIKEIFSAFQLEWHYSKKEILQLYINLLPYGGNIEGIKSASLLYLNKFPQQLSLDEIALLSVIPNHPEQLKIGKNETALKAKRNQLLLYLKKKNAFDEYIIDDALQSEITAYRRTLPKYAPHFSYKVKQQSSQNNIVTTLNKEFQYQIEEMVTSYSRQLHYNRIHNIAVIVVDNDSRGVVAYLGSQDFNDTKYAGQVDGTTALRSPGSTLKPLIYALAFDKGMATNQTIITDLPISYHGYQPENYDETYQGKVSIEYALANSLNVPAVKILDEIGVPALTDALSNVGFKWIKRNKDNLGLSLALGGCGVSLQELAGLYAAFANNGKWQPLNFLEQNKMVGETQLTSSGASFMLHEILTQITRPDLPNEFQNSKKLPKVAWKTGTSYGRRDAWSIGYNKKYTVAVWVGNFDGKGVPELSGAEIATPLMIRIFNAIDYDKDNWDYSMPETLKLRYVCKETGKVPNDFCNNQIIDYYIPEVSSLQKCNHLKKVWVDEAEQYSYCSYCLPSTAVIEKYYPNLPGDLIAFYEAENKPYQKIPTHFPECNFQFSEFPPKITHPIEGSTYFIDTSKQEKILLKANLHNDAKAVFWYVNNVLIANGESEEKIFTTPPKGLVEITCVDDHGRSASLTITVKYL